MPRSRPLSRAPARSRAPPARRGAGRRRPASPRRSRASAARRCARRPPARRAARRSTRRSRRWRAAGPPRRGSASVGPFSERPPTSGETATTGPGQSRSASRMPGQREDRPDRDDRVRRPDDHRARRGERLEHLRRRLGVLGAAELDVLDRPGRALADQPLLQPAPRAARLDPRPHRLVAHRQHARRHAERAPQVVGGGGQRRAVRQPPRPRQADREVLVAEVEPHVLAERAQRLHHRERVVAQPPAALVDAVGEPERDEVRDRARRGRRGSRRRRRCWRSRRGPRRRRRASRGRAWPRRSRRRARRSEPASRRTLATAL